MRIKDMPNSNSLAIGDVVEIWFRAIFKPSKQTYSSLIAHPNASSQLASRWVMVCVFVYVLLTQFVTIAFQTAQNQPVNYWRLLILPLTPVATYIAFNFNVLVIDNFAKLAGGISIREKLSFVISSLYSPAILLSWFLMILNLGVILLLLGIYVLLLLVIVVKSLYKFSWLKATGIVVTSALVSLLLGFPMFGLISLVRYL